MELKVQLRSTFGKPQNIRVFAFRGRLNDALDAKRTNVAHVVTKGLRKIEPSIVICLCGTGRHRTSIIKMSVGMSRVTDHRAVGRETWWGCVGGLHLISPRGVVVFLEVHIYIPVHYLIYCVFSSSKSSNLVQRKESEWALSARSESEDRKKLGLPRPENIIPAVRSLVYEFVFDSRSDSEIRKVWSCCGRLASSAPIARIYNYRQVVINTWFRSGVLHTPREN